MLASPGNTSFPALSQTQALRYSDVQPVQASLAATQPIPSMLPGPLRGFPAPVPMQPRYQGPIVAGPVLRERQASPQPRLLGANIASSETTITDAATGSASLPRPRSASRLRGRQEQLQPELLETPPQSSWGTPVAQGQPISSTPEPRRPLSASALKSPLVPGRIWTSPVSSPQVPFRPQRVRSRSPEAPPQASPLILSRPQSTSSLNVQIPGRPGRPGSFARRLSPNAQTRVVSPSPLALPRGSPTVVFPPNPTPIRTIEEAKEMQKIRAEVACLYRQREAVNLLKQENKTKDDLHIPGMSKLNQDLAATESLIQNQYNEVSDCRSSPVSETTALRRINQLHERECRWLRQQLADQHIKIETQMREWHKERARLQKQLREVQTNSTSKVEINLGDDGDDGFATTADDSYQEDSVVFNLRPSRSNDIVNLSDDKEPIRSPAAEKELQLLRNRLTVALDEKADGKAGTNPDPDPGVVAIQAKLAQALASEEEAETVKQEKQQLRSELQVVLTDLGPESAEADLAKEVANAADETGNQNLAAKAEAVFEIEADKKILADEEKAMETAVVAVEIGEAEQAADAEVVLDKVKVVEDLTNVATATNKAQLRRTATAAKEVEEAVVTLANDELALSEAEKDAKALAEAEALAAQAAAQAEAKATVEEKAMDKYEQARASLDSKANAPPMNDYEQAKARLDAKAKSLAAAAEGKKSDVQESVSALRARFANPTSQSAAKPEDRLGRFKVGTQQEDAPRSRLVGAGFDLDKSSDQPQEASIGKDGNNSTPPEPIPSAKPDAKKISHHVAKAELTKLRDWYRTQGHGSK